MGIKASCKTGSKIVQVKGLVPPEDGISRETPTGKAGGRNVVWHNFFGRFGKVMPFLFLIQRNQAVEAGRSYAFCGNREKSL